MTNQRKILIGFSLALLVVLTVGCSFSLVMIAALRPYAQWAVMSHALIGISLLALGRSLGSKGHDTQRKALDPTPDQEEHPLYFFKKIDYWGWMLVLSALPIFFLTQHLGRPMVVQARAMPKLKVVIESPAPAPAPAPVVMTKFPPLKVKGLVCNGSRSTAVVNGLTVGIGEKVEGVKVVAIERWGITVEMEGRERNITLPVN